MQQKRFTTKQMAEAMDRLPQAVKDAILDNHVDKVIADIARRYNLRIDQSAGLENEIQFTMLGLERPEKFLANLKSEAHIEDQKASGITKDVEDQIFRSIKKDLMRVQEPDYKPENSPDKEVDYDQMIRRLYKIATEVQGKEAADKFLYKIAGRDYVPKNPEKTIEQVKSNLSKISLADNSMTELLIKNPPRDNLSNVVDLRSTKSDVGPRPVSKPSFLIKENKELAKDVSKDIKIPLQRTDNKSLGNTKITLERPNNKDQENEILDLDFNEPELQDASEIKRVSSDDQKIAGEKTSVPTNLPVEKSEPSIIEKTMTGPTISKTEGETVSFDSPLKKPDVETKPVNPNYIGSSDPYREPIE